MSKTKAAVAPASEPSIESLLASIRQAIHREDDGSADISSRDERPSPPPPHPLSFMKGSNAVISSSGRSADQPLPLPRAVPGRSDPAPQASSPPLSSPGSGYGAPTPDRFAALRQRLAQLSSAKEKLMGSPSPEERPDPAHRLEDVLSASSFSPPLEREKTQPHLEERGAPLSAAHDMPPFLTPLSREKSTPFSAAPPSVSHKMTAGTSEKSSFSALEGRFPARSSFYEPVAPPAATTPFEYAPEEDVEELLDFEEKASGLEEGDFVDTSLFEEEQKHEEPEANAGHLSSLLSDTGAHITSQAFEALDRAFSGKHAPTQGKSIETLAQDLLRPMLRDWLDAHLPSMVERLIYDEIQRITRRSTSLR